MDLPEPDLGSPSRLRALLDQFAVIEDTREPHRVVYPLQEVVFLAVFHLAVHIRSGFDGLAVALPPEH